MSLFASLILSELIEERYQYVPKDTVFTDVRRPDPVAGVCQRHGGWLIVEAAIDRQSRSAVVTLEGAAGAGPNLIAQAQEAVARCYG